MIPIHKPLLEGRDFQYDGGQYREKWMSIIKNDHKSIDAALTIDGMNAIRMCLANIGIAGKEEIIFPSLVSPKIPALFSQYCQPIGADIDLSLNMTPDSIKKVITKNTKAVFAVHLFGNPCRIDEIREICNDNDLILIEDCVQSLGNTYRGKRLGSFGDYTIMSFRFSNDITSYSGGALLSKNKIIYNKPYDIATDFVPFLKLRFGMKIFPLLGNSISDVIKKRVKQKFIYSNKTLSDRRCCLLMKQYDRLGDVIERRIANAELLSSSLCSDDIQIPLNNGSSFCRFSLLSDRRDEICEHLKSNRIETSKSYDNCDLRYAPAVCQTIKKTVFQVPVHQDLSKEQIRFIIDKLKMS